MVHPIGWRDINLFVNCYPGPVMNLRAMRELDSQEQLAAKSPFPVFVLTIFFQQGGYKLRRC
jgi:hypothetical protein